MNLSIDPHQASVDQWIDWLRKQRRDDSVSALSVILRGAPIDDQRLLDLACIDLMERQRMGHPASVESYVHDFPVLATEDYLLDLIDAELCIAAELRREVDTDRYLSRFPHVADSIRDLIRMAQHPPRSADELGLDLSDPNCIASSSADFSIDTSQSDAPAASQTQAHCDGLPYPLTTPDWFVPDACVASSEGRWLIRGRHRVRGITLAFKIIELEHPLTRDQSHQWIDACRRASEVSNPSWLAPSISAVQTCYVGVIRPWLFAREWNAVSPSQSNDPDSSGGNPIPNLGIELRRLAKIAYALAAAHQMGTSHGAVHGQNLLIDHQDDVHLIDAVSNRGIARWMTLQDHPTQPGFFLSLEDRWVMDASDLMTLISDTAMQTDHQKADALVAELASISRNHPDEICATIGEVLMRWSDALRSVGGKGKREVDSSSASRRTGWTTWWKNRD